MKRLMSILIILSMTCALFPFALPAAAEFWPAETVFVDASLTGASGTEAEVKIGDKTWSVVIGSTGFTTVSAALKGVCAGGTIMLAPGIYSESVTVDKDVTFLGPKAGIDPNVRGAETTDDWTRNPLRGEGEAVLTTSWHIGVNAPNNTVYYCHDVTIDGIAISGAGMLRSNYGALGHIKLTYKNILVYDYTTNNNGPFYCYSYYPNRSDNNYSRSLIAENIRFEGMTTAPGFNLDVDLMDASGIYFDQASTKQMFMLLTASAPAQQGGALSYTIRNSMFRQKCNQVLNCNLTTGAGGHNFNKDIASCSKVTVNITNNCFIDNDSGASVNNNIIVPQINTDNVYFNITDNIFMVTENASENFIAIHAVNDVARDLAARFTVKGNTFYNIPTAILLPKTTTHIDMKKYNTFGSSKDDPAKSVIDGVPSSGKVDSAARKLTDSVNSDEYKVSITTSEGNTFKLYSDKALTREISNPVKLYKETNVFYIKIMSANGVNEKVYTATVTTSAPAKLYYDIEDEVRWLGRTYSNNGMHYFNWSASGFEFTFKGSGARAEIASNAPGGSNTAYIKIFINGVEQPDVALTKERQTVTLAEGLDPNNTYTIRVVKRTNSRSSSAALVSLKLNDGTKLEPPKAKSRLIEFVGDSITVGYAACVGNASSWSTATEDGTKTYSEYVANAFGADYNVIAVSGRGICRNYGNTTERLIPLLYASLDDYNLEGVKYDFARQADVIVINAGTNDASGTVTNLSTEEFKAGVKAFLADVRAKNPNAEIIYAYGMLGSGRMAQIKEAVEELRTAGDSHLTFLQLSVCRGKEQALGHPTAESYISRGDQIIELIESLTDWKAGEIVDTDVTELPNVTEEPTDSVPDESTAPIPAGETTLAEPTTPAVNEPEEKRGCGAAAASAVAVIAAVTAAAALKKREE